ncbi:MAG: hypothetical protein AB1762_20640 [Gemmatimonadota bacterium]
MALPAFIGAGVSIVQTAGPLVGGLLGGNRKDVERLTANKTAYDAALAGDNNALLFLKQRTGEHGVVTVPGYGQIGGWATDAAKNDAKVKYSAALAARRGETAVTTATSGITKVGESIKEAIDDTARGAGAAAGRQVAFAIAGVGVVLVLAWLWTRRGRRSR